MLPLCAQPLSVRAHISTSRIRTCVRSPLSGTRRSVAGTVCACPSPVDVRSGRRALYCKVGSCRHGHAARGTHPLQACLVTCKSRDHRRGDRFDQSMHSVPMPSCLVISLCSLARDAAPLLYASTLRNLCYTFNSHLPQTLFVLLQIYRGHVLESEHVLLDPPVAVASFWADREPVVRLAVAAGAHVYVYIGTRIHYKLSLPTEPVGADDQSVWCATHIPTSM